MIELKPKTSQFHTADEVRDVGYEMKMLKRKPYNALGTSIKTAQGEEKAAPYQFWVLDSHQKEA